MLAVVVDVSDENSKTLKMFSTGMVLLLLVTASIASMVSTSFVLVLLSAFVFQSSLCKGKAVFTTKRKP